MNRDEENFKIHIMLGGLRIPMTIPRKDEVIYRNAEKLVTKYLDDYQKIYHQRPTEEILMLVAFRLAVVISKQGINEDIAPVIDSIKKLDDELKELFANI